MKYIKSMAQQKLCFLLALYIGLFMNGAVFFRRFDGYDADRRAGTALEHAHAMEPQSFLMVRLGDGRTASPFLVQR